jgi:hypothetical protein
MHITTCKRKIAKLASGRDWSIERKYSSWNSQPWSIYISSTSDETKSAIIKVGRTLQIAFNKVLKAIELEES